jgi:sulfite reductase beta subunit-like hemoprotein
MQRIKLPAGLMNPQQARVLADIADEHGRGVIHVTTREDVQMHWIDLGKVIEIYQRLHEVGITTRGACADSVRNVTGCIHAGTWPGELFDVTPYALAVHEYFLFHPLNLTQPRKFKIAFATCEYDCVQSRINEIAYFPKIKDGKRDSRCTPPADSVRSPTPQLVRTFIPAEDVLIMTEAIVRLQHRSGERKNRKRARMKYLYQRWGAERFVREMDALVAAVEEQQGAALRAELAEILSEFRPSVPGQPPAPAPQSNDREFAHWLRTNTYAQRQDGYFGATVQLPLGDITDSQLRAVVELAEQFGSGEMRAANDQNLMIPWIPGNLLESVYQRLREIGLSAGDALHITDVTACPGADYCSLAMSRSMGVATKIRNHLLDTNGQVEALGVFRIKISGCPNACQHYVGDIGLTGLF